MSKIFIVESPAKIKKISKILGNNFTVVASYGHFRELSKDKKNPLGFDIKNNYKATFKITKLKIVNNLRKLCENASVIYIATDPDREGHGIAWHIKDTLKLSYPRTKRVEFNEITKNAVLSAVEKANKDGHFHINSEKAYLARCISDKYVGFTGSPILWKNIGKNAKSTGRVQSVATRLIFDRNNEIKNHIPEEKYKISGVFDYKNNKVNATLNKNVTEYKIALHILELCKTSIFKVNNTEKKIVKYKPPPPFKTSVLQQEAGKRFKISPKNTMKIAQKLYERGKITYHRTDTIRLSDVFINNAKEFIINKYGNTYLSTYVKNTVEKNKKKGVQNAHEAIRPTDVRKTFLTKDSYSSLEKKIYRMIWVRAVGSLMSDEICEKYSAAISFSNTQKYYFLANYLLTIFKGYKILYDSNKQSEENKILISLKKGDVLRYKIIESIQTFSEPIKRYTESTLVKALENKGIGRPSTYANIISVIQKRKYVIKKKDEIKQVFRKKDILKNNIITTSEIKVKIGNNKKRLFITELGGDVTTFLLENINQIVDYKFTSNLEDDLDDIANGNKDWKIPLDNLVQSLTASIRNLPERKKKKLENNVVGKYKNKQVKFFLGEYGPFVTYKNKCYSVSKEIKELSQIDIKTAIKAIEKPKIENKSLVSYNCKIDGKIGIIEIVNGKYGYYMRFVPKRGKNKNYFLPKNVKNNVETMKNMTLKDCLSQVEFVNNYKKKK